MSKRIVICCDGTWNVPDQNDHGVVTSTNVAKIGLAVAPRDLAGKEQVVFYETGLGTRWYNRVVGGAFGDGLSKKIENAYRFLVQNYEDGDEVFLFGFSRGAYTVRSAAGLIRNSGLLRKEYAGRFAEAYHLYRRRDNSAHPKAIEAQLFRRSYARNIRIKFIGVWDTVGALGIPLGVFGFFNRRYEFHDVKLSGVIDNAYQALAIDERRRPFAPSIWEQQEGLDEQVLEQKWFAGVHSNIGGGYKDTGLSDIAFEWLREKAETCGLAFDPHYVKLAVKPDATGELRASKKGIFKLLPDFVRPIGKVSSSTEAVHPSAVDRMKAVTNPVYQPENLVSYLREIEATAAASPARSFSASS